jgi:hypothetical protein
MNDRAGITTTSNTSHEEMKQTNLKRDEEQVQAILNHLNETMTDPFEIEAHPPCVMKTSFSNCFTRSDLQDFLIVPSSWNMDTGICPTGCERMLSIVTSSLLLAKTRARLKQFLD